MPKTTLAKHPDDNVALPAINRIGISIGLLCGIVVGVSIYALCCFSKNIIYYVLRGLMHNFYHFLMSMEAKNWPVPPPSGRSPAPSFALQGLSPESETGFPTANVVREVHWKSGPVVFWSYPYPLPPIKNKSAGTYIYIYKIVLSKPGLDPS